MAQITFDEVTTGGSNQNQVDFFRLQNDGEEAVVRFAVDSLEDLEILTVHSIQVDGKYRKISCLRNPKDPIDNCPLCASGADIRQVAYIPLIRYESTSNGIQAISEIWERNASTYAYKIKGYLDNYGPLTNILCKVSRHGKAGDLKTTYDIIPNLSPQQFPPDSFPVDVESFEEYRALGTVVMDKSFQEVVEFMNTGTFPERQENVQPQPQMTQQEMPQYPQQFPQQPQAPQHEMPQNNQYTPQPEVGHGFPEQPQQQPSQPQSNPQMNRPVRHY